MPAVVGQPERAAGRDGLEADRGEKDGDLGPRSRRLQGQGEQSPQPPRGPHGTNPFRRKGVEGSNGGENRHTGPTPAARSRNGTLLFVEDPTLRDYRICPRGVQGGSGKITRREPG